MGQLVSGVGHELNNPLTSIAGLAELLLEREPHPDFPHEHLRVIHDQAERAGRIVRNLLTFARKGVAEKSAVDLNDVAVRTSLLIVYELHKAFPQLSDGSAVFRALDYLHGTHPDSDLSFVSGVGTRSKEVAYGSNRADFSYIAGGVVPGVLIVKPDLPENSEIWPFFWGQNEYVVPMSPNYVALVHAAMDLLAEQRGR